MENQFGRRPNNLEIPIAHTIGFSNIEKPESSLYLQTEDLDGQRFVPPALSSKFPLNLFLGLVALLQIAGLPNKDHFERIDPLFGLEYSHFEI